MTLPPLLNEAALGDEQQLAGDDRHPRFFEKLALARCGGGLIKLDMSAGKIRVAVPRVAAEEHPVAPQSDDACDDLDGAGGCAHGDERVLAKGPQRPINLFGRRRKLRYAVYWKLVYRVRARKKKGPITIDWSEG